MLKNIFGDKDKSGTPEALPFLIEASFNMDRVNNAAKSFADASPFPHVVFDNFLSDQHASFFSDYFPTPEHPVWLDWRKRSPHQYGKQGPGDSAKFSTLDPRLRLALQEFNNADFITFVERVTGIPKLLPDPYFSGGGMHQIVKGGILDIHTDFNQYARLNVFRRVNVLIYLTSNWQEGYGGELELWDASKKDGGKCVKSIPPVFNRCVIFETNKKSFHGHPNEWTAPDGLTRRSIALYYYTATGAENEMYDSKTDFQNVIKKELPKSSSN